MHSIVVTHTRRASLLGKRLMFARKDKIDSCRQFLQTQSGHFRWFHPMEHLGVCQKWNSRPGLVLVLLHKIQRLDSWRRTSLGTEVIPLPVVSKVDTDHPLSQISCAFPHCVMEMPQWIVSIHSGSDVVKFDVPAGGPEYTRASTFWSIIVSQRYSEPCSCVCDI